MLRLMLVLTLLVLSGCQKDIHEVRGPAGPGDVDPGMIAPV